MVFFFFCLFVFLISSQPSDLQIPILPQQEEGLNLNGDSLELKSHMTCHSILVEEMLEIVSNTNYNNEKTITLKLVLLLLNENPEF